jgi:ribose transport system permease protein
MTMVAGHGLVTAVTESFGLDYPVAFTSLGPATVLGLPVPVIVFALVVLVAHVVLTRSAYGRQLYAVGNDLEAAKRAGIRTDRILFSGSGLRRLAPSPRPPHLGVGRITGVGMWYSPFA